MKVVIGSCFRNSPPSFVLEYSRRIEQLVYSCVGVHSLDLVAVWGDSINGTKNYLEKYLPFARIVERTHGFPEYGSSELPNRLKGFGYAANGVFESVPEDADVAIYVESDILWSPFVMLRAIEQLQSGIDLIALPPFIAGTDQFYDIWGFRGLNGIRFSPFEQCPTDKLTPISSAGTCLVMRGEVARSCRCTDQALVGFCEQATDRGYKLWTDWSQRVIHPR